MSIIFFKINDNMLDAILISSGSLYVRFLKNGKDHNTKNAALIRYDGYKQFYLNNKLYGYKKDFTKKSWRKFVKMQVFL